MDGDRPKLSLKKLLIIVGGFFLVVIAATLILTYEGPGQDVEGQEPQFEFAAEGSKIAGIQILVENGWLSWQQYKKVFSELNARLPEMESSSRYFVFVDESLAAGSNAQRDFDDVVVNYTPGGDGEEVEYEQLYTSEAREEMETPDTVTFTMRSESNAEYAVEVYTGGDLTTAEVKIERK